jgi:hypothetical protein
MQSLLLLDLEYNTSGFRRSLAALCADQRSPFASKMRNFAFMMFVKASFVSQSLMSHQLSFMDVIAAKTAIATSNPQSQHELHLVEELSYVPPAVVTMYEAIVQAVWTMATRSL